MRQGDILLTLWLWRWLLLRWQTGNEISIYFQGTPTQNGWGRRMLLAHFFPGGRYNPIMLTDLTIIRLSRNHTALLKGCAHAILRVNSSRIWTRACWSHSFCCIAKTVLPPENTSRVIPSFKLMPSGPSFEHAFCVMSSVHSYGFIMLLIAGRPHYNHVICKLSWPPRVSLRSNVLCIASSPISAHYTTQASRGW